MFDLPLALLQGVKGVSTSNVYNSLLSGAVLILTITSSILALRVQKNKKKEDEEKAADEVADRLITLQKTELAALQGRIAELESEVARRDSTIADKEREIASLAKKVSILTDAIFNGTKDYRTAVAEKIHEGTLFDG